MNFLKMCLSSRFLLKVAAAVCLLVFLVDPVQAAPKKTKALPKKNAAVQPMSKESAQAFLKLLQNAKRNYKPAPKPEPKPAPKPKNSNPTDEPPIEDAPASPPPGNDASSAPKAAGLVNPDMNTLIVTLKGSKGEKNNGFIASLWGIPVIIAEAHNVITVSGLKCVLNNGTPLQVQAILAHKSLDLAILQLKDPPQDLEFLPIALEMPPHKFIKYYGAWTIVNSVNTSVVHTKRGSFASTSVNESYDVGWDFGYVEKVPTNNNIVEMQSVISRQEGKLKPIEEKYGRKHRYIRKMYTGYPILNMDNEIVGINVCIWNGLPSTQNEIAKLTKLVEQEEKEDPKAWYPLNLCDMDLSRWEMYDRAAVEKDIALYWKYGNMLLQYLQIARKPSAPFSIVWEKWVFNNPDGQPYVPQEQLHAISVFTECYPNFGTHDFAPYMNYKPSLEMLRNMLKRQQQILGYLSLRYSLPLQPLTKQETQSAQYWMLRTMGGILRDERGRVARRFPSFYRGKYYCTQCIGKLKHSACAFCGGTQQYDVPSFTLKRIMPFRAKLISTSFGYQMGCGVPEVEMRKFQDDVPTKFIAPVRSGDPLPDIADPFPNSTNSYRSYTKRVASIHEDRLFINLNGIFLLLMIEGNPVMTENQPKYTQFVFCANRLMTMVINMPDSPDGENQKLMRSMIAKMSTRCWKYQIGSLTYEYYFHKDLDISFVRDNGELRVKIVHRKLQRLAHMVLKSCRQTILYVPDNCKRGSFWELLPALYKPNDFRRSPYDFYCHPFKLIQEDSGKTPE